MKKLILLAGLLLLLPHPDNIMAQTGQDLSALASEAKRSLEKGIAYANTGD